MGWFKKMFGLEKPETTAQVMSNTAKEVAKKEGHPPYKIGPDGTFDQSGLAKRVAAAFDEDAEVANVDTVWVAQTSGTVVLKGHVASQAILDKLVSIAKVQEGAEAVDSSQVTIS